MALFGKNKDNNDSKASEEKNVLEMVKEPKANKTVVLKENTGRAHRVLRNHHLSEKTNSLSQNGRYVFVVARTANKIEVKKAVESVYEVHVASVNMVNVRGKSRRQGRTTGTTSAWKKAIVTLKAGESIAALSEGV